MERLAEDQVYALLQLQRAVHSLNARCRPLEFLLISHTSATDDILSDEPGPLQRKSKMSSNMTDTEEVFAEYHGRAIHEFEEEWVIGMAVERTGRAPSSTWLDHLDLSRAHNTVQDFLQSIMKEAACDCYVFGSGIAISLGGGPTSQKALTSTPAIFTLMDLVRFISGSDAVLQLLLGIFETAFRELVGHELSSSSWSGIGLGILGHPAATISPPDTASRAREQELQDFLLALLEQSETLDSTGL